MIDSEPFGKQTILRFHHVEIPVVRKFCAHSVARLARFAVTDSVREDDEKFRRIERLVFREQLVRKLGPRHKLRAAASCPVHDQNCIRRSALRIFLRLSNGPVMEMQLWQCLARRKFKVADREIAFRRRGIISGRRKTRCQERRKECQDSDYGIHTRPQL